MKDCLIAVLILFLILASCSSNNTDTATMLRVQNFTEYEIVNAEVNLFFGGNHIELDYQDLADGEASGYQEIPIDSLNEEGDYCTYTNVETESLNILLSMASVCTRSDFDRAIRLNTGNFSLILETEPTEYLNLSFLTHEQNTNNEDILISIKNNSEQDFSEVRAIFPASATTEQRVVNYGAIKSGESSEFESVDLAYRYTEMLVITETDTLRWQPIDYVGEQELEPGKYSYELNTYTGPADISRIVRD